MAYLDQILTSNERVIRSAHRHPIFMILHIAPYVLGVLVVWALAIAAFTQVPRVGGWVAIVLLIVSLFFTGVVIYRFLVWRGEQYVITNYRIIQVEGILDKRSLDSALEKVNDVELMQTFIGRIFDYGSIHIMTASDIGVNDLSGLGEPFEFKRALQEAKLILNHGQSVIEQAQVQSASQQVTSPQAGDTVPTDDLDPARVIRQLTELRNSGVLSESEYDQKLREIAGQSN